MSLVEGNDGGWRHGNNYDMLIDTLRRVVGASVRQNEVTYIVIW